MAAHSPESPGRRQCAGTGRARRWAARPMCLQPRGRIINAVAEMVLLKRVQALLELPTAGPDAPTLMHMERTLTDGYAWALALEAERARLARRLGDLAA